MKVETQLSPASFHCQTAVEQQTARMTGTSKGWEMGLLPALVCPWFRKNEIVTCKNLYALCILDILLACHPLPSPLWPIIHIHF